MAEYQTIELVREDNLLWLRFARPQVLNAFSLRQWREVAAALREAQQDDRVRAVALAGNGGNFSAGYDLSDALGELGAGAPGDWRAYIEVGNETCWTVWGLRKPVIAAVQGYCLGGAFELAMACDFVLSGASGRFGEPEVRLSDAPPFLISPWVMNMRAAKDLLLTGDVIDAEKAQRYGLLSDLVPDDALAAAVRRLAGKLAGFSPDNWHLNKAAVNRSYEIMGFAAAVDMGADAFVATNVTPNALKRDFLDHLQRQGFAAAVKWAQSRYRVD
ncbi:MAG: enoyl-CoA hydratase/isomerase family protein [Alphaproteobacteria bacterium]|nr:enoyl-CoA hydratase/isomerase family protein [Alphaproteobacteria bacterium]